jgi:predicted metal-dependent phosphoesterase TrpH
MFKVDLHVHTILGGDSHIQPDELVTRALEVGLDAVCVTEHHSYALSEPVQEISRETNFPIFRGTEYRAVEGHLLVFGVKVEKSELFPGLPMQFAVDWVNGRGGVAIPAHSYQKDMMGLSLGDRVLDLKHLIALEVINGSATSEENRRALEAATQLGVKGIGGSDAHGLHGLGKVYTLFPNPIGTEEDLILALRCGGYTPHWNENMKL